MPALWIFLLVVIGVPFVMYLFVMVHRTINRICVRHARNYCVKNHWEIARYRYQPAFDKSGIKSEYTLVQLDCVDAQNQRKLVVLLVWPFGVRKVVSDEIYPGSYDEKWPHPQPSNSGR